MKYKDLKALYINELRNAYGEEESSSLFHITYSNLTGYSRIQYLEQQHLLVAQDLLKKFQNILAALKLGKPLQYILGETDFYGLKFKVSTAVLIPRDETEELVDLIIRDIKAAPEGMHSLLDVGTGSGCIAIAIKAKLNWLKVSAMDVSAAALAIAKENALFHQLQLQFIQADVLEYQTAEKFDIIVSNPPYIKVEEKEAMRINVLEHEPHLALFVSNEDPLVFYKAIARLALTSLNPSGRLYFEINENLGAEMVEMISGMGFRHIQLIKDMQQKDRILSCQL
jgi:release factor glutamine methyltransferase